MKFGSFAGALSALLMIAFGAIPTAAAQPHDSSRESGHMVGSDYAYQPVFVGSPELGAFELRIGSYRPDLGPAFESSFGGDLGPYLALEVDGIVVRIPYVGPLMLGGSFGWSEWTGAARTPTGAQSGETGLSMINFNLLLVLRVDVLARELGFPMVFSGKIGPDVGYFQTGAGGTTQADGWSVGLRWGAQAALELDFLEPRSARRLDDDWGINHSLIFFELFGSTMGQWFDDQLPLGTGLAWVLGLGFAF